MQVNFQTWHTPIALVEISGAASIGWQPFYLCQGKDSRRLFDLLLQEAS